VTLSGAWAVARRILPYVFFAVVATLFAGLARHVHWDDVLRTLREIRAETLILAAVAALASYGVYGGFDLLGKVYTGHHLRPTS
jgi:uncharacterized membrane protein YbhN (UPF0104 family)